MHADVARLDLSLRRRSLIGYTAGLAVYVLVVVAVYPAFRHSTALDNLTKGNSAAAALFGVSGSLTSPGGWLNGNVYENFFPLILLLMTIGYGATALAGQDEDGTLGLVAALPLERAAILVEKVAAMALQALVLAAGVTVCVLIGRSFDLPIGVGHAVGISLALALMGLDFGIATMAVGAATGRRGTALGVGSALAAATYLVSSLAPVVSWIRPARYASLLWWSAGHDQIVTGVTPGDYAVLLGVGAVALWAAIRVFARSDLR